MMARMFGREKPYDRNDTLAAADKARAQGKSRKAIAGYRKVLEHEPGDAPVLAKLAPLLAKSNDRDGALRAFTLAADAFNKKGFAEKALAVIVQAAAAFPAEVPFWREISRIHLAAKRRADAVKALLEGRHHQHGKKGRKTARELLREAVAIEPWHPAATRDLAGLLAKDGERGEAKALLAGLAERTRGGELRRVRGAQLRMAPTPAALYRWLRALLAGR
jgi:tetratricopeptide (TPR) repeat protein